MWSKVSTPPTPLSEKLVHRGTPSILFGFPNDSLVTIHTPGWRDTMWSKVSCPRKPHDGRDWDSNNRPSDLKFIALTLTQPRLHNWFPMNDH